MGSRGQVHQSNRRFEFGVYHALPEHPRPMYERDTYGRVGDSLSHSAGEQSVFDDDADLIARIVIRNGKILFEKIP
jgi:hypothetical protein